MSALFPQAAAAFSSRPEAVLRNAASVRVVGQRMAIVAGALAVLLGVGAASQATELPFFGKESSVQEAAGGTDATNATSGTRPTSFAGPAAPRPTVSTRAPAPSSGTPTQAAAGPGGVPAAANPRAIKLPAVSNLPMPVDAPTLAGIAAATSAAAPPASASSSKPQSTPTSPPAPAPAAPAPAPAPPTTTAPKTTAPTTPAPAPTAPTTTAPTPIGALLAPLPLLATATAPAAEGGTVDTRAYASSRLASYGWGAEQMTALNSLWDTSEKWRSSQVDTGLSYIKKRYGSPAAALKFRAANNWY